MTIEKPNLLILGGVWPHIKGNHEAANVISHEVLTHLATSGDFNLSYCVVNSGNVDVPVNANEDIDKLKGMYVNFLPPQKIIDRPVASNWLRKIWCLLTGQPELLMVGGGADKELIKVLSGKLPDAVLVLWAEQATYLASKLPVIRFNYAGNPDHKVWAAQIELKNYLDNYPLFNRIRDWVRYLVIRYVHIKIMARYHQIWNVANNDALMYREIGLNSSYLRNMWHTQNLYKTNNLISNKNKIIKIVGNVGNLSATGNSLGIITLCEEILPLLRERMGEKNFEIHIFGAGTPHPAVSKLLNQPNLKIRGFVEDLESEILSSDIFLISNNNKSFKVSHTRFLHAWSLGACVVAFEDSALAMPEIKHNENAILAKNNEDIVNNIIELLNNDILKNKISNGGKETLSEKFNPREIVLEMKKEIKKRIDQYEKLN